MVNKSSTPRLIWSLPHIFFSLSLSLSLFSFPSSICCSLFVYDNAGVSWKVLQRRISRSRWLRVFQHSRRSLNSLVAPLCDSIPIPCTGHVSSPPLSELHLSGPTTPPLVTASSIFVGVYGDCYNLFFFQIIFLPLAHRCSEYQ